jgi:ATP-binding cassette subfamily B protein
MTTALRTRWPRLALLVDLARPHSATLALGFVLGLTATGIGLAGPMVTKWVLDSLAASRPLTAPLVGLLVLFVVGSLITMWQWVLLGRVAERIARPASS